MAINVSGEFNDVLENGYVSAVVSVGTSEIEAKVGTSKLAGRECITIYNDSNSTVYYGPSGVTTSGINKGQPLFKRQHVSIPAGEGIEVFLIAESSGNNVIIQEWA
jgi:hypothetical protein